jgi:hypothetical protein
MIKIVIGSYVLRLATVENALLQHTDELHWWLWFAGLHTLWRM